MMSTKGLHQNQTGIGLRVSDSVIGICVVALLTGGCSGDGLAGLLSPSVPAPELVDGPSGTDFCTGADDEFFADQQAFEEALEAYEAELIQLASQLEALEAFRIRIVNDTSVIVSVQLVGLFAFPERPTPPGEGTGVLDFVTSSDTSSLQIVDQRFVSVSAQGTVEGAVKCAELIGVSLRALDGNEFVLPRHPTLGAFIDPGNVILTGVGDVDEQGFTGDVISGARFFSIDAEGVDCTTDALVIHVESASTRAVHDEMTGEVVSGATPGRATLRIE